MDLELLEAVFFWGAVFSYVAGFCIQLFGFVTRRRGISDIAVYVLIFGWALHTGAGVTRWVASGHAPVTGTYELNLTGVWFTLLVFLLFQRLALVDRSIGIILVPIAFLVLGHGYMNRVGASPMGPAYQSAWLVVHVVFAWLGFGCYAVATGTSVMLLLKTRFPEWKPVVGVSTVEALDVASYRFVVLGFINHAVMLVSGAIWAKKLWGRYWSWDALETWSLIAFLFYAFCLHARAFLKWKTTRAAWLAVAGLAILAISFWGVDWFAPGRHPGP